MAWYMSTVTLVEWALAPGYKVHAVLIRRKRRTALTSIPVASWESCTLSFVSSSGPSCLLCPPDDVSLSGWKANMPLNKPMGVRALKPKESTCVHQYEEGFKMRFSLLFITS